MARVPVHMPKYGLTMEEGTIVEWKVEIGDTVAEGDLLLSVETEKVVTDLAAPAAGTVVEKRFAVDDDVPVGEIVAWIEAA